MITKYIPSGKCRGSVVPFTILGVVIAAVWGAIYQVSIEFIPWIYLTFLLTLVCGFGTVVICSFFLNFSHCRNVMIGALAGLAIGFSVLATGHIMSYIAWSAIIDDDIQSAKAAQDQLSPTSENSNNNLSTAENSEERFFFLEPLEYAQIRANTGWSIGSVSSGAPVTGIFFYLTWIIEAVIMLGAGIFGGIGAAKSPYCERCSKELSQNFVLELVKK